MNHPNSGMEDHPAGTGDLNALINSNWQTVDAWFNPAEGKTIRQDNGTPGVAGTVLTSNSDMFTADMDGATIRFADGAEATIDSITDGTHAVASASQSVAAQAAEIYQLTMAAYTALARGLVKRNAFVSGDASKVPVWSHVLQRFVLDFTAGTNITAGWVLFGGGASLPPTAVSQFAWDDSAKQLNVTGNIHATKIIYSDVSTSSSVTGSQTPDFGLANTFQWTLTGNVTVNAPTNAKPGAIYRFVMRQDGTGSRAVTWNAVFKFPSGAPLAIKNLASTITALEFVAVDTNADSTVDEYILLTTTDYGTPTVRSLIIEQSTLTYAASTAIDLLTEGYRTVTLTGDITFTTSNRSAGRGIVLRIIGDSGADRNFTWPSWKWPGSSTGAGPTGIATGKTGLLTLTCWGSNDSDITATWLVEP